MYQKLFEPGTINRLRLKNRIVLPAMGTGFDGWNGEASEDLIAYFEERARGGAGLIITGYCRVDSELGAATARQLALFDLKHVASIEKLALNMENMVKEQRKQGERLEVLENRDGEMWRKVVGYAVTAVVGILLGFLFQRFGM